MKILLTGYAGFLGRYIAESLAKDGHSLRVILHSTAVRKSDFNPDFEVIWGDIKDRKTIEKAVAGVDAIVHSAWIWPAKTGGNDKINLEIVESLWQRAVDCGVKRFVFISSVAVYGMRRRKAPLSESEQLADGKELTADYVRHKIQVEQFLKGKMAEATIATAIFRPGIIIDGNKGPARALKVAGRIVALGFGTGRNHLPFIHAADVATAITLWMQKGNPGAVYNLSGTSPMRVKESYRAWYAAKGIQPSILFIPAFVMRLAGLGILVLKRLMGKKGKSSVGFVMASATRNLLYSNAAAKRDLGWADTATEGFWRRSQKV